MVDFVLRILRKFTKISPLMTKLFGFVKNLLVTRSKLFSEDSKKLNLLKDFLFKKKSTPS